MGGDRENSVDIMTMSSTASAGLLRCPDCNMRMISKVWERHVCHITVDSDNESGSGSDVDNDKDKHNHGDMITFQTSPYPLLKPLADKLIDNMNSGNLFNTPATSKQRLSSTSSISSSNTSNTSGNSNSNSSDEGVSDVHLEIEDVDSDEDPFSDIDTKFKASSKFTTYKPTKPLKEYNLLYSSRGLSKTSTSEQSSHVDKDVSDDEIQFFESSNQAAKPIIIRDKRNKVNDTASASASASNGRYVNNEDDEDEDVHDDYEAKAVEQSKE
jgi:hypothetical protein